MRSTRWRLVLLIIPVTVILIVGVWQTYVGFTARHAGGNDFLPRWVGGCALLREGANPYSEEITLRIQQTMYGRPARTGEDRAAFAYPLYSLLMFWPLCVTESYALARAIWLWVLLAGLLVAMAMWVRTIAWRPRRWVWTLVMLWTVFFYHNFRALVLGQFAVLVLLAVVAAVWALWRGHDGWAGFLLALSTVKPQMVYLAIPWMLLWAAGKRRWRLWWSFGISMALLILGFTALVPSWVSEFAQQVLAYSTYTVYGSLTWIIVQYFLGLGGTAEVLALALLATIVLMLAWRLWRGTWEQMVWMLGLLLLLTNFFTPRIATTNYLTLVPWAVWGMAWVERAWGRRGSWAVAALAMVSGVGLWVLFLATLEGNFERAPVYLPFPLTMLLVLAWLWRRIRSGRAVPEASRGKR